MNSRHECPDCHWMCYCRDITIDKLTGDVDLSTCSCPCREGDCGVDAKKQLGICD